jgi:uncharacterized damage-inducible protein DinB
MAEPWLRGTLTDVDAVKRQVLHALELAQEDCARWCSGLTLEELEATPLGLPSIGFHLRHIARSLDRLLTYAEGRQLDEAQRLALGSEMQPASSPAELFAEFELGITAAAARLRAIHPATYEQPRGVGRQLLPSTVAGLIVHCAEHTQRHAGQMVTTAKVVLAMRVLPDGSSARAEATSVAGIPLRMVLPMAVTRIVPQDTIRHPTYHASIRSRPRRRTP